MKKHNNEKGFTLAELLIVVAIVSVLVAISIPIFNGKLIKAKLATNDANIRAAKAAAIADYLTEGTYSTKNVNEVDPEKDYITYYTIDKGTIGTDPGRYDNNSSDNGIYPVIKVTIDSSDKVETSPRRKEKEPTSDKNKVENYYYYDVRN